MSGVDLASVPRSEGEEYMSHAEFEERNPEEAQAAAMYEQARRLQWIRAHATEEGYASAREFPCLGMLRIEDQSGVLWPVVCDRCGYEIGVQVQKIDPGRLLEHRLARAALPELAGKEFEDVEAQRDSLRACRQWIRQFRAGAVPAPALWGGPGRGKTHLLALIARGLIENYGVDLLFRSASGLLDELQAGFDHSSYEQQWQRVLRVPVLVLDDLGAQRSSEWRDDRLAQLVDFRYQRELPLLVATNIPPARWVDKFGERTSSRLRGMTFALHLDGQDRRSQGVQQSLGAVAS